MADASTRFWLCWREKQLRPERLAPLVQRGLLHCLYLFLHSKAAANKPSMMTLTSSGGVFPIGMASMFMLSPQ
jgi:hypothetical protein